MFWANLSKIFKCFDCPTAIDPGEDPYHLVVPHGARGLQTPKIPLCRDCRVKEGYDINGEFCVVESPMRAIEYKQNNSNQEADAEASPFKGD